MATTSSHNKKSSSVKRILSEARELSADTSTEYTAAPLEDNIFEWHFTLRGPSSSEFADGLYHGRILLPAEYPMRPPSLLILTPNGRWELNKKICLTFTGFHEEMWQPAWGIRTALLGIQTFMTAKAEAAVGIGALDYSVEVREKLAKESRNWKCPTCNCTNLELLPDPDPAEGARKVEALPEGLTIDAARSTKKEGEAAAAAAATAAAATSSTSSSSSQPSGDTAAQAVPPLLAARNEASAVAAPASSTTATIAAAPSPAAATADNVSSQAAAAASTGVAEAAAAHGPTTTTPAPLPSGPDPVRAPTTATAATAPTPNRTTAPPPAPRTASLPSGAPARTSSSEQTLALIDRCIALLVGLVALLIIKRLV